MTEEMTYPTLDAVHAVLIAAYDATRFHTPPELGGQVGRLRRAAAVANDLTVRACAEIARAAGGLAEVAHARAWLAELAECVEAARRQGLDQADAAELLGYQSQASRALAALEDELRAEELAA